MFESVFMGGLFPEQADFFTKSEVSSKKAGGYNRCQAKSGVEPPHSKALRASLLEL